MLASKHFLFGLVFAGFLYLIFPSIKLTGLVIVSLSSFLIDADHYIYYLYKKKDFNLRNSYRWFMKRRKRFLSLPWKQRNFFPTPLYLLHGIEVLLIFFLFGVFLSKYFLFVFTGFAFHLLLDSIIQTTYWDRISKVSLVNDYSMFKK